VALLSMAPGERALVRVGAGGAYGEAGNFSFPAVAPNAALLYDVELLYTETASAEHDVKARARCVPCVAGGAPKKQRHASATPRGVFSRASMHVLTHALCGAQARGDMLWEERMAAAARYRDEGNAAFRNGDADTALTRYTAGLSFIDDGMMAQLMGQYMDESAALKAALHSNCAAAALALARHDDALAQAGAALALAPRNAKALYRKGKAHAALGQDDAARTALTKAAEIDPADSGIRAALKALDACAPSCVLLCSAWCAAKNECADMCAVRVVRAQGGGGEGCCGAARVRRSVWRRAGSEGSAGGAGCRGGAARAGDGGGAAAARHGGGAGRRAGAAGRVVARLSNGVVLRRKRCDAHKEKNECICTAAQTQRAQSMF
jgi:tetratricopeptide (TPR) repeat protein